MTSPVGRALVVAIILVVCGGALPGCGGAPSGPETFTYQLLPASSPTDDDGSSIASQCTGSGVALPVSEPLSGSFTLGPAEEQTADVSMFTINNIAFRSASYTVNGQSGTLSLTMSNMQRPLAMTVMVDINGEPVELTANGSQATFSGSPPTLRDVPLSGQAGACGVGGVQAYMLTVFAAPEI